MRRHYSDFWTDEENSLRTSDCIFEKVIPPVTSLSFAYRRTNQMHVSSFCIHQHLTRNGNFCPQICLSLQQVSNIDDFGEIFAQLEFTEFDSSHHKIINLDTLDKHF